MAKIQSTFEAVLSLVDLAERYVVAFEKMVALQERHATASERSVEVNMRTAAACETVAGRHTPAPIAGKL